MRISTNVIPFVLITTIILALSIQAAQPTVGILAFTPKGATASDAEAIRELVISELVKTGKLNVLDRENTTFVVAEQAFQQSGFTDKENAVKIGKLLDAQFMVYGSLMRLGIDYVITVNMVSVETAGIVNSSEKQFKDIAQARSAVQAAIYGIAMMKRKTGERWSRGKTAAFTAGLVGAIGASVLGAIGFSKYNTAKGWDIDIQHMTDPVAKSDLERERDQEKASADIVNAVAIVSGAVSLGLLIWSYYIPKTPIYEDIPWTGKATVPDPQPEPDPQPAPADTEPVAPVPAEESAVPPSPDTVVVYKVLDPINPDAVAMENTSEQTPLPRMYVQRMAVASDTFPTRPVAEEIGDEPVMIDQESPEIMEEPDQPIIREPADTNPDRNRSGINLHGATLWGDPWFYLNGIQYRPARHNALGSGYTADADYSSGPLVRINLDFPINVAPYVTVKLGQVVQWQSFHVLYHSSTNKNVTKIDFTNGLVGFSPGVNYVKRMAPWKINAGIFGDIGLSWLASTLDSTNAGGYSIAAGSIFGDASYQETNWANAFGWGLGVRAGAEYLINDHFGINLDILYRFSRSGYTPNTNFTGSDPEDSHIKYLLDYKINDSSAHPAVDIIPPMFGFAIGMNVYF